MVCVVQLAYDWRRVTCMQVPKDAAAAISTAEGTNGTDTAFILQCNGTQEDLLHAPACPVIPACLFWDKDASRWSDEGCQWIR